MATYEEYMNAARNADAAGDEGAARKLVQAAQRLRAEPQQEVSTAVDVAKSLGSGLVRGGIALAETPELLGRLGVRGYEEAKQLLGGEVEEETPIFDTVTGRTLREATTADDYQAQTTAGKYAGTVGEFLPAAVGGPAGLLRRGATAAVAGLGSEAAGQATEGTSLEPVARVVGAFAAPSAISGIKNKTVQALTKRSIEKPNVETAKAAKNAAYNAFTNAGGKVNVNMNEVVSKVERAIDDSDVFIDYTTGTNQYVDAARQAIIKHTGKELNLAQVDKLRAALGRTYKNSGFDPKVEFIRDQLDEVIDTAPVLGAEKASDLLSAARTSNRRYKKTEAFEEAMQKAERAGGDVVKKYRTATRNILNSKSQRAKFDAPEIEVMEAFLAGKISEKVLGFAGNLAPSGTGYGTFLNLGAFYLDPTFLLATGAATGGKMISKSIGKKELEKVRNTIITGVKPEKRKLITDREIRILLGLQAEGPEEQ
jgi:hypothetical protein